MILFYMKSYMKVGHDMKVKCLKIKLTLFFPDQSRETSSQNFLSLTINKWHICLIWSSLTWKLVWQEVLQAGLHYVIRLQGRYLSFMSKYCEYGTFAEMIKYKHDKMLMIERSSSNVQYLPDQSQKVGGKGAGRNL